MMKYQENISCKNFFIEYQNIVQQNHILIYMNFLDYITSIPFTFPFICIHKKYIINYMCIILINKIILIFIEYMYVHSKSQTLYTHSLNIINIFYRIVITFSMITHSVSSKGVCTFSGLKGILLLLPGNSIGITLTRNSYGKKS